MFRLWAKVFENNHMIKDIVIENDSKELTRTKKIFAALDDVCHAFDLGEPIWLDSNIDEFKKVSKTRFRADNFIESIEFDYLEIQIIEEDALLV